MEPIQSLKNDWAGRLDLCQNDKTIHHIIHSSVSSVSKINPAWHFQLGALHIQAIRR